jgi:hypothetical protein
MSTPGDEREPARLAAQRAAADAVEIRAEVEAVAPEVGHHGLRLFDAVVADGADQVLAQGLGGGVVVHLARPQGMGDAEIGARPQPAGEVVARAVVEDRLRGHRGEPLLQAAQVAGPGDLGPFG